MVFAATETKATYCSTPLVRPSVHQEAISSAAHAHQSQLDSLGKCLVSTRRSGQGQHVNPCGATQRTAREDGNSSERENLLETIANFCNLDTIACFVCI